MRDRYAEFVFELEEEFEEAKRIDAQLIDWRIGIDCVRFTTELFGGEFLDGCECIHGPGEKSTTTRRILSGILVRITDASRAAPLTSLSALAGVVNPVRHLGFLAFVAFAIAARAQEQLAPQPQGTPIGLWNTISDRDGKPTAVVEIRLVNNELSGVVRELLVAADPQDSICSKCPGDRKGQRIVGMEILRHMRRDGDAWSGGEILDPENGKTYRATLKLTDGGQKLVVRGYIGIPLFGRSQTWVRRTVRE